ncbi:MAG: T9SS type A sorting domain-containing protein, partial [Salibacteraceae bacterium]
GVHGQLEANHNGQVFYVNNNNDLECVYWSNGWKRGIMPSQWVHPNPGIAAGNTRGEIFFFGAYGRVFRLYHGPSPGCPGYSRLDVAGAVEQPIPNPPGELIEMADISVFPNPTSGQVRENMGTTIAQDQEGGFNLEVVNMVGQVIQTLQPTDFNGQGEAVIELDDQPAGMYLLTGQIGSVIINEKVVLKK